MTRTADAHDAVLRDALQGLERGDFSRLEPLFDDRTGPGGRAVIVEELLNADARLEEVEYPTGHAQVDAVLRRHGAA